MVEVVHEQGGVSISHLRCDRIDNGSCLLELSHLQQVVGIYQLCLNLLLAGGFIQVLVKIVFVQIELPAVGLHATGVHLHHLIG